MASLPVLLALTYLSWLATLRIAWDVSTTVSDEAVETVKAIGAEARSVAEAASMEARSWVVTFGAPIRGAIYLSALFLGTFALWLLVSSLRKFWPTWPSPYAHGMRDEQPAAGYTGTREGDNLSLEIRRRGQAARQAALQNLGTSENLRAGASRRSGQNPQQGAPPAWLSELQAGSIVDFIYLRTR